MVPQPRDRRYDIEPWLTANRLGEASHLSADDRRGLHRAVRTENDRYMTALRGLYRELTGCDADDNLDARALYMEIMPKLPTCDVEATRRRLTRERTGRVAPPADLRDRA